MIKAIGIDFGTTNSVVACVDEAGNVETLSWPSALGPVGIFRSALAFWRQGRLPNVQTCHAAGPRALEMAIAGDNDMRFLQSIKTYVASSSFQETRLFGKRFDIEQLVALFLQCCLEPLTNTNLSKTKFLAGRPVVFAGSNANEELALRRLKKAYALAGRSEIDFAFEPLGAAYWYARSLRRNETVLVADFGGGTSDFSILRFTHAKERQVQALAHGGCPIAGDSFDFRLIDHLISPQLGKDSFYRSFDKRLPIPAYFHNAFSQWHQLSFLKSPETMLALRQLQKESENPTALQYLIDVIELDLGFELYQKIGQLKALLSEQAEAQFNFDAAGLHLQARVKRSDFEHWIAPDLERIDSALTKTLTDAGLTAQAIDAVFLTGGTSYIPALQAIFAQKFGRERMHFDHPFQSVASGLALLAADQVKASR